jgi:hypothetical protein
LENFRVWVIDEEFLKAQESEKSKEKQSTTDNTSTTTTSTTPSSDPSASPEQQLPAPPKQEKDGWKQAEKSELGSPLEVCCPEQTSIFRVLVERRSTEGAWPRALFIREFRDFRIGDIIDAQDTVSKVIFFSLFPSVYMTFH